MADEPALRAGTALLTLFWLVIGAAWCYLFVYIGAKKRSHFKGRAMAIEMQTEIALALLWILLAFLAVPLLKPHDASFRRAMYLMSGATILELSCFIYASIKHLKPARHKYSYLVSYAYWFGGGGMFLSGLTWVNGYPTPIIFEAILVGIATAMLIATEVWFLVRNEWHILPRHPK